MNTKPILFSTEMVQVILEGRKTQTRRIVKKKYCNTDLVKANNILYERQNDVLPPYENENGRTTHKVRMNEECIPQYQIGDILYVRETWAKFGKGYIYKADGFQEYDDIKVKWKPSIHMPKKVARIFLEAVNVKVERLQDISEEDAIKEGLTKDFFIYQNFEKIPMYKDFRNKKACCGDARSCFMTLWQKIYGEQNWNDNPFVWVYEFKVIEKPKEFNQ